MSRRALPGGLGPGWKTCRSARSRRRGEAVAGVAAVSPDADTAAHRPPAWEMPGMRRPTRPGTAESRSPWPICCRSLDSSPLAAASRGLTDYFLPGYWPHAALYLGSPDDLERMGLRQHEELMPRWRRLLALDRDEPRRVLEAMRDGVCLRSLRNPFRADALTVVRPQVGDDDIARAIGRGMEHEGKPYDFDFDFSRSDRLVCTEVVYRSYDGIGGMHFAMTRRAGRLTIAAEDLLRRRWIATRSSLWRSTRPSGSHV